ncbi:hypothetical protein DVS28_a0211 [Euzebya pacifica]|uniref:Uncharacterized protein n=1 Tax=Euzebya pacifica TaxID=1608957 RepID=A0A346XRS2_9ACTN|nr:hypothetical protein DVS28_a0211 [Euzebya pacifica]
MAPGVGGSAGVAAVAAAGVAVASGPGVAVGATGVAGAAAGIVDVAGTAPATTSGLESARRRNSAPPTPRAAISPTASSPHAQRVVSPGTGVCGAGLASGSPGGSWPGSPSWSGRNTIVSRAREGVRCSWPHEAHVEAPSAIGRWHPSQFIAAPIPLVDEPSPHPSGGRSPQCNRQRQPPHRVVEPATRRRWATHQTGPTTTLPPLCRRTGHMSRLADTPEAASRLRCNTTLRGGGGRSW